MIENDEIDPLVSRETNEKLQGFVRLVLKWTKSINLIAPNSVSGIWERHISDSCQVFFAAPEGWKSWADLGSGGGFPGIVVSILDDASRSVTLVESDTRKSIFLNTVKRELGLNVHVVNQRIENARLEPVDIVSARALAPLPQLLDHASHIVGEDGTALFLKGKNFQEELDQAKKSWHFECESNQSSTNAEARLLKISRISPRER